MTVRSTAKAFLGRVAAARARLHAVVARAGTANASPRKLGVAVALGVIIGCSPLFGAHIALCLLLSWLLRLNGPAMYAAAHVSSPPFIPFVGFVCVQAGERIPGGGAGGPDGRGGKGHGENDSAAAAAGSRSGQRSDDSEPARGPDESSRVRRLDWASLLRRTWSIDALSCPRCAGRMRLLSVIEDPQTAARILDHLRRTRAPP